MDNGKALMVHAEVICADISNALQFLIRQNIVLHDTVILDELTAHFFISRRDYYEARECLRGLGAGIRLLNDSKLPKLAVRIRSRIILLLGFFLLFSSTIFLSQRVLLVQVNGCLYIPPKIVLEKAASYGVKLGAKAREIRNEAIKNQLLIDIPQLQWVGVNTQGSVLTISVTEKTAYDKVDPTSGSVTSIIASNSGIIESVTVTSGNALCSVGQAVRKGQILISGYTDCGLYIKAQEAQGEVFAKTLHKIHAVIPTACHKRGGAEHCSTRYRLRLGKKLINFYKDSGIPPTTCVKMYEEIPLSLPGGFNLPISLIRMTYKMHEVLSASQLKQTNPVSNTERYLKSQLIAGRILESNVNLEESDSIIFLSGQFLCSEMISHSVAEESIQGEIYSD